MEKPQTVSFSYKPNNDSWKNPRRSDLHMNQRATRGRKSSNPHLTTLKPPSGTLKLHSGPSSLIRQSLSLYNSLSMKLFLHPFSTNQSLDEALQLPFCKALSKDPSLDLSLDTLLKDLSLKFICHNPSWDTLSQDRSFDLVSQTPP